MSESTRRAELLRRAERFLRSTMYLYEAVEGKRNAAHLTLKAMQLADDIRAEIPCQIPSDI